MHRLWPVLALLALAAVFAGSRTFEASPPAAGAPTPAGSAAAALPQPAAVSGGESASRRDEALVQETERDWSISQFDATARSGGIPVNTAAPAPGPAPAPQGASIPEVTFSTASGPGSEFQVQTADPTGQTFGSQLPSPDGSQPEIAPSESDTVVRGDTKVRAAFYYPWFPQAWSQDGVFPFTKYHPSLGFYSSSDLSVIREHIDAMQYGHIDAGIASWWGSGHYTDTAFAALLQAAAGTGFKWAVYYEGESVGNPTPGQIRSDLRYVQAKYAHDPSYLRVDGRWVVFVYSTTEDRCDMAERWKEAALPDAFIVLKAFPGARDCAAQPDAWHYYNPLVNTAGLGPDSFAVSPGYTKPGDDKAVARDLETWKESVRAMVSSTARFQLILTFNEWGEGTAIESADEWASPSGYGAYLDVLHDNP